MLSNFHLEYFIFLSELEMTTKSHSMTIEVVMLTENLKINNLVILLSLKLCHIDQKFQNQQLNLEF